MLETLQFYNSWIWNIIGILIGAPILLGGAASVIMGLFGAIIALFSFRNTNVN